MEDGDRSVVSIHPDPVAGLDHLGRISGSDDAGNHHLSADDRSMGSHSSLIGNDGAGFPAGEDKVG